MGRHKIDPEVKRQNWKTYRKKWDSANKDKLRLYQMRHYLKKIKTCLENMDTEK